MKYLDSASLFFSTGYFIDSNAEALKMVCKHCADNNKPMVFSLAGTYVIKGNYDDMMEAVEYSDFVIMNSDEGLLMG